MDSNAVGQSGEYLAASLLQRHFPAIAFPNVAAPYDLIVQTKNSEFLRCQIKTTKQLEQNRSSAVWKFTTARDGKKYGSGEIDFFVLVALPKNLCAFYLVEECDKGSLRIFDKDFTEQLQSETFDKVLRHYL